MKQVFLNLPTQPTRFAKINSNRRMGFTVQHRFASRSYKSDGGDDDNGETELLQKIQKSVEGVLQKRGLTADSSVQKLIEDAIKQYPLDAIRSYSADKEKQDGLILSISGEIEKLKQRNSGAGAGKKENAILLALNSKISEKDDRSAYQVLADAYRAASNSRQGVNIGTPIIELNVRAAANMTLDNIVDNTDIPEDLVDSFTLDAFVPKRYGYEWIWDVATRTIVTEMTQYTTWLEEGTLEGAFAEVAEGAVKPLVSTQLVRNYAEAKKVAGKYVFTEETQMFKRNILNIIQGILQDQIARDYAQKLITDLNSQASGYVGTSLDGTIANPNNFDAIGAVAAQIETLNFVPDTLVLHPQDFWQFRLAKNTDGNYYMMLTTTGLNGSLNLLGFRVITSTRQTAGTFTLGESRLFKVEESTLIIRAGYGIDVTTSGGNVTAVSSDFDNNRMRIIVELFYKAWLATNHAGAFVTATFANVKAVLATP